MFDSSHSQSPDKDMYALLRKTMVDEYIKSRGIKDPAVLNAMLHVARHHFVPEEYKDQAYEDHPLPIDEGQTISQPYIVAFMTEALKLSSQSRVLEVGTGSGYQAAVLAEIVDSVFSIEIIESLAQKASRILSELGYTNIEIKTGNGYLGWAEKAPFDAIIVTCAPTEVPDALTEQLSENGKIIIPVGSTLDQNLFLLEKRHGKLIQKRVLPVRFVPMIDENGAKY